MLNTLTANTITHPSVNGPAILRIADAIEKHSIKWLGFNMGVEFDGEGSYADNSGHDCKTVACIAGWTEVIFNNRDTRQAWDDLFNISIETGRLLGLDEFRAHDLFFGQGRDERKHRYLPNIPIDQAVRTLRHLAFTGKVDWTI